ncbi:multifunctional CCA addition/repair protein, partial [Oleiphilus sp. HI0123]
VVGSNPDEMLKQGFTQVGQDFPVFLHPKTREEYALARTERKNGQGYQGFSFDTSKSITLEQDLIRRDLSINAMAMSADGELIDPYGGQDDLKNRLLRHVSPSFTEDPLRILRVARFAARFYHLGFKIADETLDFMSKMVLKGEANHLVPERIWQETERALSEKSPWIYFEVLRKVGCLKVVFPEIDALFGIPQPEKYHPEIDCGIHALMSLEQASQLSQSKQVRFAALTHDLGKACTAPEKWPSHHGHERLGLEPIKKLCERNRVPNEYRDLACLCSEYHTHIHKAFELRSETILKVLKQCDAFRRPERFAEILLCSKADSRGRTGFEKAQYQQADLFSRILHTLSLITTKEIVAEGYKGKEIGEQLDRLRKEKIKQIKSTYEGENSPTS